MAYVKAEPFKNQFEDVNGNPLSLGTIEFYVWNTATPTPYYTDSIGTSGGTSLTLNTLGKPANDIFYNTAIVYKIITKDAAGSIIDTLGPFSAPANSANINTVLTDLANTSDTAKGDALVGTKVGGANTVATTVHGWIDGRAKNIVTDYGADPTGSVDATTAFQNFITDCPAAGYELIARGRFKISSTLNWNKVFHLVGTNQGQSNAPANTAATELMWYGGASPVVILGGNGASILSGGLLRGLRIDARALATDCLKIIDLQHARFADIDLANATARALTLTNTAGLTNPTGFFIFDNVSIFLRGGSTNAATGIVVDGQGTAAEGVTLCTMRKTRIQHANGAGVLVKDRGDAFIWEQLNTFRSDAETGSGVWFNSTNAAAVCGGHTFNSPVCTAGFRFDTANIHAGTRIINLDTFNVNTGILELVYGAGAAQVEVECMSGQLYGGKALTSYRETIEHDSMRFIRWDSANSVLLTKNGAWKSLTSGGVAAIADAAQTGGAIQIKSDAVNNDIAGLRSSATAASGGVSTNYFPYLSMVVATVDIVNVIARFGLADSLSDPPTNGIYVEADPATSGLYRCVCRAAGVSTAITNAALPLGTGKIHWRIEIQASAVSFYYRVTGFNSWGFMGTITTNIPATTVFLDEIYQVAAKTGASKSLYVFDHKIGFRTEV